MRIGLLTVFSVDYGSYQQTLSLYRLLEKMGHAVTAIHESHRYTHSPKLFAFNIARYLFPKTLERFASYNDRIEKFFALREDVARMSISPYCLNPKKRYRDFDCIIVGSDELWSATNKIMKYIPDYFGYYMPCDHISYGTSASSLENPDPKLWSRMEKGLNTFLYLSARDKDTVKMVEQMTNKPCPMVLDPSLLNPIFGTGETTELPYILVYGEHFSDKQVQAIKTFAKDKQLPLVAVAWPHAWCNEFRKSYSASALQQSFAQSAYCIVSTFHGAIFSIIHRRSFTSFDSRQRGKKVKELLNQLALDDYLFENSGVIQHLSPNYEELDQRLAALRADSLLYLKTALDDVERRRRNAM